MKLDCGIGARLVLKLDSLSSVGMPHDQRVLAEALAQPVDANFLESKINIVRNNTPLRERCQPPRSSRVLKGCN